MTREFFISCAWIVLIAALVGCGNSMTTIRARRQAQTVESTAQSSLAKSVSLYESGNYVAAEKALQRIVTSDSTDWQAWRYLGLVRYELGRYDQAVDNFLLSLDQAPDIAAARADLYASLGKCWEKLENPGQARLHYHTALNLWPQCTPARSGLARLEAVTEVDRR